ncbi:MAG TPA: hypothetical protein VIJ51_16310 [Solirubrobacteraceae bacterium]
MNLTRTTGLLSAAGATVIVAAAGVGAAAEPVAAAGVGATATAETAPTVTPKVTGAYLFIQRIQTAGGIKHPILTPFATLVYRTDIQLPRSSDGSPNTGGATIAGQGGSIGSIHGKASRCYVATARIKPDNTITGTNSSGIEQTRAIVGSRLPVTFTTLRHGTVTHRTLTLRGRQPGDLTGKPLGC